MSYEETYDDFDEDELETAEEWQEGTCCQCSGSTPEDLKRAAEGGFMPVCACAIGQGAPPEECECGPEIESGAERIATMSERVRVKVLLLFGDQAEIVADVPSEEQVNPARYPAVEIAEAAGVEVQDLPGMRLTADVGPGDRLREWRLA